MTGNLKILILSAAFAAAIAPALVSTQAAFAQTTTQSAPGSEPKAPDTAQAGTTSLVAITKKNVYSEIVESDKPAVVLVTTPDCSGCAELISSFAVQAAKRPYMKFGHGQAPMGRIRAEDTPYISIHIPGAGQTYTKVKFASPADMDVFMDERIDRINQIMAARAVVDAIRSRVLEADKPFRDERDALLEQEKSIGQPFEERMAAIVRERDKAVEPFKQKLKEIANQRDDLIAAVDRATNEIWNRQDTAAADLNKEWSDLDDWIAMMKGNGISADHEAMKNATARIVAIRLELDERSKPFDEERYEVKATLRGSLSPLTTESIGINAKIREVSTPYNEQRQAIRDKKDEALKDMPAKFTDLQARQKSALSSLMIAFEEADSKFENLAYSEQS